MSVTLNWQLIAGVLLISGTILWWLRGAIWKALSLSWAGVSYAASQARSWASPAFILAVGVLLVVVGMWPKPEPGPDPQKPDDAVSQAFDTYENLWRISRVDMADRITSKELTDERAVRDALEESGKLARRTAFEPIAKAEQQLMEEAWDPDKYAEILRSYGGGNSRSE